MFRYLNNHLSSGFVALYSGRMIQYAAFGLLGLFIPIYLLLNFGHKIQYVLFFYLIGHLLYALILPFGVKLLNKIGLRRSLRISIVFFALYYFFLFFLEKDVILYSGLALIVLTIARLLFWLPYHTDLAKFTQKGDRGKSVSIMWASITAISMLLPVVSGFILNQYGYDIVFMLAIGIYLCALIPYMFIPRTRESYSWTTRETWKQFVSRKNRKIVVSNMANGADNAVGIIIWPVFIWQVLNGNYLAVGALSSLIVLATVVLQLSVGKYADIIDKRKMIHWGSILYALGWFAKVFVLTSLQIFVVGTYHSFAQVFKDTPFDTLNYELLADQGHFVDEYTVLKEIAVQLGKVIMLVFASFVALNFGLNWTFILAAMASLLINLI